ncbi:Mut7-C RNAse domain-containing protein [Candidatus Omnitrophota bacterium]
MKFILTRELGRLAKWLRILGYDTEYFREDNYSKLKICALREERTIITRNHRLGQPRGIPLVMIEHDLLKDQIQQIMQELHLESSAEGMFSLCTICNKALVAIKKAVIKDKVPEYVFQTQEKFLICPSCKRIYWAGTHWGNVEEYIDSVT